jgi:hypothetical protein
MGVVDYSQHPHCGFKTSGESLPMVGCEACLAMPAVLIQEQYILSGGVAKHSDLIIGVLKAAAGPGKQKIGSP